jgi:hypothetical protein
VSVAPAPTDVYGARMASPGVSSTESATAKLSQLRFLAALICVLGAAAVIVSLWLNWFSVDTSAGPPGIGEVARQFNVDLSLTGFESFDFLEWVLIGFAGLAVLLALLALAGGGRTAASGALALGLAAAIVVGWRLIDPPGENLIREPGVWLALGGSLAILAGGAWLSRLLPLTGQPKAAAASGPETGAAVQPPAPEDQPAQSQQQQ